MGHTGHKRKRKSKQTQSSKRIKINAQTRKSLLSVYDKDSSEDSSDSDESDRLSRIENRLAKNSELQGSLAKQLQMLVDLQSNRQPDTSGNRGLLCAADIAHAVVGQLFQYTRANNFSFSLCKQ